MIIDVSKSPEHHNSHLHDNLRLSLQPSGFFAVHDAIFVMKVQDTIESIALLVAHDDYDDYYDEDLFISFCLFCAFEIQLIWKRM